MKTRDEKEFTASLDICLSWASWTHRTHYACTDLTRCSKWGWRAAAAICQGAADIWLPELLLYSQKLEAGPEARKAARTGPWLRSWILVFSSKNTFPRLPKSSLQCDIPAYAAWAVPASLSLSRKVILRKAWGEAVPEQRAGWQQHGTGTKTTVTCSLRSPGKA